MFIRVFIITIKKHERLRDNVEKQGRIDVTERLLTKNDGYR